MKRVINGDLKGCFLVVCIMGEQFHSKPTDWLPHQRGSLQPLAYRQYGHSHHKIGTALGLFAFRKKFTLCPVRFFLYFSVPLSLCQSSSSFLLELLKERVDFALGRLDTVGSYDASGPVKIEHVDELLTFHLKLLDLGLQF